MLLASLAPIAGCSSGGDGDEQARLQALLQDQPLQQVPPGTSTAGGSRAAVTSHAVPAAAPNASGPPVGSWNFDDCIATDTELLDNSFSGNDAFRAVNVACTDGVQGKGVAIAQTEDIVYVPDQPQFTFEQGVTVAGWFKPTAVNGTRTLIRKRDRGTSSFALVLTGGKYEFIASFGSGRAASVTAPARAKAGAFQHVAATYDGATLRLYLDGIAVTSFDVTGTIPVGAGPLLMGNDGSERRFDGAIDNALFATHALTADEVLQLTCLPEQPTVALPDLAPALPGVPVAIDIAVTNHNPAVCTPITFGMFAFPAQSVLTLDPPAGQFFTGDPVPSGQTGHLVVTATATDAAEPGEIPIQVFISAADQNFFDPATVVFTVASAGGCDVISAHELMITTTTVVDDPIRTKFDPASSDPRNGVWTFKRLMENLAPSAADAPAMVEAMLATFDSPQTINGFTVVPRPGMRAQIVSQWPRTQDGKLDLAQAPLHLQAIVDRFDLRNLANGDAGEGRFVFAFYDRADSPLQATMIFEYKLPAASDQDVLGWAQQFHALGALAFGDDYNAALQAITDRFTARGARPGHPNASAINSVRTNEIDFGDNGVWELRQFGLSADTGLLEPLPLDLTPSRRFDGSATLASYISANQDAIIAETHTVPASFQGQLFQAGAVFNDLTTWFAPDTDPSARHHFAINTCNGCHSTQETGVAFLQVSPRRLGTASLLSGFLTGITILDPVTRALETFNDLARRRSDLKANVCPGTPALAGTSLRKGIQRVH